MNADTPDKVPMLTVRLEALRESWSIQALALERIYGPENAGAKAFRCSIGDLYHVIHPESIDVGTVYPPLP